MLWGEIRSSRKEGDDFCGFFCFLGRKTGLISLRWHGRAFSGTTLEPTITLLILLGVVGGRKLGLAQKLMIPYIWLLILTVPSRRRRNTNQLVFL